MAMTAAKRGLVNCLLLAAACGIGVYRWPESKFLWFCAGFWVAVCFAQLDKISDEIAGAIFNRGRNK